MLRRQIFTGDPNVEINVQHILLERCSVATDADEKPSLDRLGYDGVKRLGVTVVMEGRRGGEVQCAECLFGTEPSRGPTFQRRQPLDRARDAAVQTLQLRRLEMVRAGEPIAMAGNHGSGPSLRLRLRRRIGGVD